MSDPPSRPNSPSFRGNQSQHQQQHVNAEPSQWSPYHLSPAAGSRPNLPHRRSSHSGSDYSLGSGSTHGGTPSLVSPSQDSHPSSDDESHSVTSDPAWNQEHQHPSPSSPLTADMTATTMTSLFTSSPAASPTNTAQPDHSAGILPPPRPTHNFYHPSPASIESLAATHLGPPAISPPAPIQTNPFRPSDFLLHQPSSPTDMVQLPFQFQEGQRWPAPPLVAPVSIAPDALRRWVESQQRQEWERQLRRNLAMDIGRRAGGPAPPYSPTPSYSNLPPPQPLPSPTLRHESSPDGMQEDYDMEPAVGERPPSLPPLAFMQPSISAVPSGPPSSSTRGGFRGGSAEAFRAASLRWDSASDAWQPDSSFDQPDYNVLASSSSASILQRLQRCLFLPSRRRQASDAGPSSSLPFSERPTAQTSHDIDSQQYDEKNEKRCPGLFGWSKSMPDDNNDDDDQKSQRFHNACSSSSALPPSYEVATGPSSSSSAIELDRSPTWQQQRRRQCVRLAMLLCFLLLIAVIIAGIVLLA